MNLTVENRNYCALVFKAETFTELPNCDNVKGCLIFGNQVIVGKDMAPGTLGLYFPVETQILPALLGPNNLYRKAEYGNVDPTAKGGFFEANGRVRCMKFRGHRSEGFFVPLASLTGIPLEDLTEGVEFNKIGDLAICDKYIPKNLRMGGGQNAKPGIKKFRKEDLILDGQFRFHYDTAQLKRNLHRLELDTPISISDKWHGTSVVVGHLLTKRILPWYERLAKRVGVQVKEEEYGIIAASRRVVKSVAGEVAQDKNHFYDTDLYSLIGQEIADRVPKGFTVYGEIVGYTPKGSAIQKHYGYRCLPEQHRLLVYRVTFTNHDGHVYELTWEQLKQFCEKVGLETVIELWKGTPRDFLFQFTGSGTSCDEPYIPEEWRPVFLETLQLRFLEKKCPYNNGVPNEGVVIRIDRLQESEAYKLKSFAFLEHETKMLDEGAEDLETAEEAAQGEENG